MARRTKLKILQDVVDEVLAYSADFECNQYENEEHEIHFFNFFPKDAKDDYVVEIMYLVEEIIDHKITAQNIIDDINKTTMMAREQVLGASIN